MTFQAGITLETALITARQTSASVAERAKQHGYYSGARALPRFGWPDDPAAAPGRR
jgi:hypothetical protein